MESIFKSWGLFIIGACWREGVMNKILLISGNEGRVKNIFFLGRPLCTIPWLLLHCQEYISHSTAVEINKLRGFVCWMSGKKSFKELIYCIFKQILSILFCFAFAIYFKHYKFYSGALILFFSLWLLSELLKYFMASSFLIVLMDFMFWRFLGLKWFA